MKRFVLAISIPALCLVAAAAPAAAKKKDPTKITCEEFAAQTPEGQTRITAFLDGYSKRGKKVEEIGDVDVQRQLDVLVVSCAESPKVKTEVEAAGEVDLERDVAVLVESCKPTPKASLWQRVKEKF